MILDDIRITDFEVTKGGGGGGIRLIVGFQPLNAMSFCTILLQET